MRRARFISLVLLLASAAPGAAQVQATADLGLATLKQPDIPRSGAQTFGATLIGIAPRAWGQSNVLLARTSSERWTAQGTAQASVLGPQNWRVRWDLSGALSAFAETNTQTAASAELFGRLLTGRATLGGALGFGGGVRRADLGAEPVVRGTASAWTCIANERFGADVSLVRTSTNAFGDESVRLALWYTDVSASWRHELRAISIGATGGARISNTSLVSDGGWGSVDATVWVTPRAAIVAAAGRAPQDVVRGVPRITYASVTLRLSTSSRPALMSPSPARTVSGPLLTATRERIEIRVDSASSIEVMGDFTDWNPVALERKGNVWRLERALSSGVHRLMMRIDGGSWTAPANLPKASDELGGVVALVTVP
ncbi:MAG TPA: glycogen-binding domain-containing protein [Gemmatimonadaceae bacterium]